MKEMKAEKEGKGKRLKGGVEGEKRLFLEMD